MSLNHFQSRGNLRIFSTSTRSSRDGLGIAKGYYDATLRYVHVTETLSGLPDIQKPYKVLGIETSCDDTGVAIVQSTGEILSNVVFSQVDIHEKFGGIVPGLAMEAHKSNINKALEQALAESGLKSFDEIDAIAVTKGPGLEICLRVGLRKAQEIARLYNKPFVTIHHLEAHCLVARMNGKDIRTSKITDNIENSSLQNVTNAHSILQIQPSIEYPFIALLASGGHTSLMLCKEIGEYTVLGGTLDDALGEAFDKVARLLGLRNAGTGGAAVEVAARGIDLSTLSKYQLGVPMQEKMNCDFSYAGLKNSMRMAIHKARVENGLDGNITNAPSGQMEETNEIVTLPPHVTSELCAAFQDAAFQHVEQRLNRALDYLEVNKVMVNGLVVVGGVASNLELRRRLSQLLDRRDEKMKIAIQYSHEDEEMKAARLHNIQNFKLLAPPPAYCTDNGVMIAWAGIEKLQRNISNSIEDQESIPRWPLGRMIEGGSSNFINLKKKKEML